MHQFSDMQKPNIHCYHTCIQKVFNGNTSGRKNRVSDKSLDPHKDMKSTENGNHMGQYNNGRYVDIKSF